MHLFSHVAYRPNIWLKWLIGIALGVLTACGNETPLPPPTATPPIPGQTPVPPALASATAIAHVPEGRIVFSHEGDIYTMNADGSERERLTDHPADEFDPDWSPDGTRIAYRSHRDDNEEIYVMQADGSAQTNLTRAPGTDYSPSWSPDGTQIAFTSSRDKASGLDIWVMNADGTVARRVTDAPGIQEYPTWSPDSRHLAFSCTLGRVLPTGVGDFEICVVNLDGSGMTPLTDAPGTSKLPAWSPDGTQIAIQSDRNGWPTLPAYTPPGYAAQNYGDNEIFVMNMDGSTPVNLTLHPREDDEMPAWSPDGALVFSRYGCLMALTPETGDLQQLTRGVCADHFPDWGTGSRSRG